jgi:pimeloyl-ACP methyl ester carboxylesterase
MVRRGTVRLMIAALLLLFASIEGSWIGTLDFGFQKLRFVLHIQAAGGKLTATADSPDQGAKGIPVTSIEQTGEEVKFALVPLGVAFSGRVLESEIRGDFTQGGVKVPLSLRPLKAGDLEVKRPQIPRKPYPYSEVEVAFDNPRAPGVRLAGTLTVPPGPGKFPAVALITGSGAQTRDQEVAGHPVFLVLADALTRAGIAVLRCDDRGFGKSTGSFSVATTADFADDAEAALEFLRATKRFKKIGLLGHSEGGIAAPMVAARNKKVNFLVVLAPAAVPGRELILAQKTAILRASGVLFPDVSQDKAIYDAIAAGKQPVDAVPKDAPKALRDFITAPWTRHFLMFDPATAFRQVKVPILALFGENDLQVLPKQNEPALRAAVAANKRVTIVVVPGVNHLFQRTNTGLPTEYGTIEETMSPAVLDRIANWLRALP